MSSGIDYPLEETVHLFFTTRAFATGIPGTLSAATVEVYEDGTTTPILSSIAVTESVNSRVGLNMVPIVATAANGFNTGASYHAVIQVGTVDSVSVVGEVIGHFSIERSNATVDIAALSTKQDSDMVVIATADTKTQSDIALGATVVAVSNLQSDMLLVAADATSILVDTKTTIPGTISSVQSDTAAIEAAGGGLTAAQNSILNSILVDTSATLDNKLDSILVDTTSILVDTKTTIPATVSNLQSDMLLVASDITSILVDTQATLDNKLDSILVDTGTTIPGTITTLDNEIASIYSDTTIVVADTTSILVDTKTTIPGTISSVQSDTAAIEAAGGGLTAAQNSILNSILVDTSATLDNKLDSILVDTTSVLVDTKTTIPATISNLQSDMLLVAADATSILVDTKTTIPGTIASVQSDTAAIELAGGGLTAAQNSILNSILVDTSATLDNKIDSILVDTKTTIPGTISFESSAVYIVKIIGVIPEIICGICPS